MEQQSLLSTDILRANSLAKREKKNRILKFEIEGYSMDEFIERIYDVCEQNCRGSLFQQKLINDAAGVLISMDPKKDKADVSCGEAIIENKLVFLSKNNVYRFTNLRDYQNFDYFIICLVDDMSEDFTKRFYLINKDDLFNQILFDKIYPMYGTTESNRKNVNYNKCANLKKEVAIERLNKFNILPGTNYIDLHMYLSYLHQTHLIEQCN